MVDLDAKKIVAGVFIVLTLLGSTYYVAKEDVGKLHYCEVRNLVGLCDSLSAVNSKGIQYRCYSGVSYKTCRSGWVLYEVQEVVGLPLNKTAFIDDNCQTIVEYYNVSYPTYEVNKVYDKINDTYYDVTSLVGYEIIEKNNTFERCSPFAVINGLTVDFLAQGYNCSEVNNDVVCDSCTDGNCDGICDSRGGETCCKILPDGSMVCKNSQVDWVDTQIHVNKFEIKKSDVPIITLEKNERFVELIK